MSDSRVLRTHNWLEDEITSSQSSLNVTELESSVVLSNDCENRRNNNYVPGAADFQGDGNCNILAKSCQSEISGDEDETSPLLCFQEQRSSCRDCSYDFFNNITVEPWLFLVSFGFFLQQVVMKNLVLEKVCIFTSGPNDTDCMNSTNLTMENNIQVRASNIEMYYSLVETVPAIFFSIFLGAFSDLHSRKVPMLIPVIGYTISSIFVAFCASFMEQIPPEYLMLVGIPRGFSGGLIAAVVSAFSYISDVSAPNKRTMRMAIVQGFLMIGQPIGTLAGSYISQYSYVLVFAVGGGSFALAAVYIVAFIKDPESQRENKTAEGNCCSKFFNFTSYKDTLTTFFKRREGNTRFYILMLLVVLTFILIPEIGQSAVSYLFLRLKFHWDLSTFSYFSSLASVSTSLGLLFGSLILVKKLKLKDMALAAIGILGMIAVNLSFSFINSSSWIYLVCLPLFFTGITSLGVRATLSKLVPRDEQGKVFSVVGSFEAITPFLSSLIYAQTYNATEAIFPEAVFIMSACLLVIPLIIVGILYRDIHKRTSYVTENNYEKF